MTRKTRIQQCSWAIAALSILGISGCAKPPDTSQAVTLVFSTITFAHAFYHGDPDIVTDFTKRTGIKVKLLPYGSVDMGARRVQHLNWLKGRAATPDVYEVDVIDVGTLAPYVLDLTPFLHTDDLEHMPAVMANLTFGPRIVALPVRTDVGLLFYRTDLLKKYGYAHPPRTWDELETMASRIQVGERSEANKDFSGFVWEGSPQNEGLMYTALEWQASSGGGVIIEPDGTISVNNPWTIAALRRAKKWVGTISPRAVTAYQMEDLTNAWLAGRAAFMRNWPYCYSLGQTTDSFAREKFDAVPVPAGQMGSAGTLGGWQVMVSPYSRHPKEAVALVEYLTSRETQLRLGREFSWLPTRAELYDQPDLLGVNTLFRWLKPEFAHLTVARPSRVTGDKYPQVAEAYKQAVHDVLTGQTDAGEAMRKLENQLVQITGLTVRRPAKPLNFTGVPVR